MKWMKKFNQFIFVFVLIILTVSESLFAQLVTVLDTLAFTQISNLTNIQATSRIRTSADGSKVIFTGNFKMVYTMNADGSGLKQVFDYEPFRGGCPCINVFIDISGDGSTILWTDGINEIFTANFDGSNKKEIASLIPRESPFADDEPDIRVPPRLTYDGSTVFFIHTSRDPEISGLYRIFSSGIGLTKLFSYKEMSRNVFGMDGSEYNYNTAFSNYLDISDDGTRGVFATHSFDLNTGHIITFNNSSLNLLRNYGPLHTNKPTGIGQFSISRDGNRIAVPFRDGSNWVEKIHVMDFNGNNQIELPYTFGTISTFQLDSTGSHLIATYHLPEYGGYNPNLISIVNIDSASILDLTLLEGNPQFTFRDARSPVFNYNAKTVFFANGIVHGDSLEQIWKLDINPETLTNHPNISDISLSPNYVFYDDTNYSTFTASITPGIGNTLYVNWDTFMEGSYVFRGLGTYGTSENLVDDGTFGDIVAGDGIYTRSEVYRDLLEPPATLTIRIHADAGKYITSVDVAPLFVLDSASTSIDEKKNPYLPERNKLYTNYPNPFNPSTIIEYSIANSDFVVLDIYDMLGRKTRTLVSEFQTSGIYSVEFDASNLASGIYFYKLQIGRDFVDTKNMLLMK